MRACEAIFVCCLLLVIPVAICHNHGVCRRLQACGVIQNVYSVKPSTTTASTTTANSPANIVINRKGVATRGERMSEGDVEHDDGTVETPLLYDEFMPTVDDEYDTAANPTTAAYELCSCDKNETCPLKETDESRLMHLDEYISLAFCRPVVQQFPMQCKGRRAMIRVIGRLDAHQVDHPHMVGFEDSIVSCSCASGRYHRDPETEAWKGGVLQAFKYTCS